MGKTRRSGIPVSLGRVCGSVCAVERATAECAVVERTVPGGGASAAVDERDPGGTVEAFTGQKGG